MLIFLVNYYENCCSGKCDACATNGVDCLGCESGYGLVEGLCSQCLDSKCSNCDGNYELCLECFQGYGLNADSTCQACGANCMDCGASGAGKCDTCAITYNYSYGINPISECAPCAAFCRDCSSAGYGKCDLCTNGYGLTPLETCGLCDMNDVNTPDTNPCVSCWFSGAGKCDLCNETLGYFLTYPQYVCDKCDNNTFYDSSTGSCDPTKCIAGYSMAQGSCLECSANCNDCSTQTLAGRCDSGQCASGYVLVNGICESCDPNCSGCTTNGASFCDSGNCTAPYILSATNTCVNACSPNCSACPIAGAGKCDVCQVGYRLSTENYQCIACDASLYKCEQCEFSANQCTECISGYSVNSTTNGMSTFTLFDNAFQFKSCIRCAYNCQECMISGYSDCDICMPGYTLIKSKSKTMCVDAEMANNCVEPYMDESTTPPTLRCAQCAENYSPSLDRIGCAYNRFKNCKIYLNDLENCFECEEGYGLVDDLGLVPVFKMSKKCVPKCDLRLRANEGVSCEQQLKYFLFQLNNYNPLNSATFLGKTKIDVYMFFTVVALLDINSVSGKVNFIGYPSFYWKDDRLAWTPEMWRNSEKQIVTQSWVWKPDIQFYNHTNMTYIADNQQNVALYSGSLSRRWFNLVWEPLGVYQVDLNFNMTDFPYDAQQILFRLQSTNLDTSLLNLHLMSEIINGYTDFNLRSYVLDMQNWRFANSGVNATTTQLDNAVYDTIYFWMSIQRSTISHDILIFWPLICFMVLALLNLQIKSDRAAITSNAFAINLNFTIYMMVINSNMPGIRTHMYLEVLYFLLFISISGYTFLITLEWVREEQIAMRMSEESNLIEPEKRFFKDESTDFIRNLVFSYYERFLRAIKYVNFLLLIITIIFSMVCF